MEEIILFDLIVGGIDTFYTPEIFYASINWRIQVYSAFGKRVALTTGDGKTFTLAEILD